MTQEQSKIIDFVAWCSKNERELPVQNEQPNPKQANLSEKRSRTGAKEGLYPPQYFAGQYPDLWKIPAAADAAYYMSKGK